MASGVILGPAGGPRLAFHHHSLLASSPELLGEWPTPVLRAQLRDMGPSVLLQLQPLLHQGAETQPDAVVVAWQPPARTTGAPVPTQTSPASAQHLQRHWSERALQVEDTGKPLLCPPTTSPPAHFLLTGLWATGPGEGVLHWCWGASAGQPSILNIWYLGVSAPRRRKSDQAPIVRVLWPPSSV